jgi:hypothetical protein
MGVNEDHFSASPNPAQLRRRIAMAYAISRSE